MVVYLGGLESVHGSVYRVEGSLEVVCGSVEVVCGSVVWLRNVSPLYGHRHAKI